MIQLMQQLKIDGDTFLKFQKMTGKIKKGTIATTDNRWQHIFKSRENDGKNLESNDQQDKDGNISN